MARHFDSFLGGRDDASDMPGPPSEDEYTRYQSNLFVLYRSPFQWKPFAERIIRRGYTPEEKIRLARIQAILDDPVDKEDPFENGHVGFAQEIPLEEERTLTRDDLAFGQAYRDKIERLAKRMFNLHVVGLLQRVSW